MELFPFNWIHFCSSLIELSVGKASDWVYPCSWEQNTCNFRTFWLFHNENQNEKLYRPHKNSGAHQSVVEKRITKFSLLNVHPSADAFWFFLTCFLKQKQAISWQLFLWHNWPNLSLWFSYRRFYHFVELVPKVWLCFSMHFASVGSLFVECLYMSSNFSEATVYNNVDSFSFLLHAKSTWENTNGHGYLSNFTCLSMCARIPVGGNP